MSPSCPLFLRENIVDTRSPASHLRKNTFLLQIIEITGRSLLDCICNLLILRIGDFPVSLQINKGTVLPVVQTKFSHGLIRQPISPEGDGKFPTALRKSGSGRLWARLSRIIRRVPVPYFSM